MKTDKDNYRKNHGIPGVVYILENPGLRAGMLKIGCSRHSGALRARQLNDDANTATPALYTCVFECRTLDCGLAEERVHEIFQDKRRGKHGKSRGRAWGQEFFEVDVDEAKRVITEVCASIDKMTVRNKGTNREEAQPNPPISKNTPPVVVSSRDAPRIVHGQSVPTSFRKLLIPILGLIVVALVINSADKDVGDSPREPGALQHDDQIGFVAALTDQQKYGLQTKVRASLQPAFSDIPTARTAFTNSTDEDTWLAEMALRVGKRIPNDMERREFLRTLHWESSRAGVDPQLLLALIDTGSGFKKYAVSPQGARGYTQVLPFWVTSIGDSDHNLFHLRTNLRYGAVILRHYIDIEHGDLDRALADYRGTGDGPEFAAQVIYALKTRWGHTPELSSINREEGTKDQPPLSRGTKG